MTKSESNPNRHPEGDLISRQFGSSGFIRHSSFVIRVFMILVAPSFLSLGAETSTALSAWLDAQKNVDAWSADFVQTRHFKTLTQPLTESGKVWFAEPNRFRWELGHPAKTIAVRSGDEMLLFYPMLKRVERYPLNSAAPGPWRDALALLEAGFPRSKAEMESKFRIASQ